MKLAVVAGGGHAAAMLASMNGRGEAIDVVRLPHLSIAVSGAQLVRYGENLYVTIGTPIGKKGPSDCGPSLAASDSDTARIREHFAEQEGAFASVHWNDRLRKLTVVTDFLGFKPLYMRRVPGGLEIANETKAWNLPPDPAGWGAFVSFGHTIGDGTLLETVERVRPATILEYDLGEDKVVERSYWRWPDPADESDIDGLAAALLESVALYAQYDDPGKLLLSGGYDSRLIGCLLRRVGVAVRALTVRHTEELGDADGRLAASFARRQAIPLEKVTSSPDFFASPAYRDYLFDTDASTPSLHLFIAQVAQFVRDVPVWEGVVPGNTLTTPHQTAGGFAAYLAQECRSADSQAWVDARTVFSRAFAESMYDGFHRALRTEVEKYPDNGHGVSQFIVRNRARNRTSINPLKVLESRQHAYLPGMTRRYFDLAGTLSFEARQGNRLYHELLRRHFPEALEVPVVSGGVLIRTRKWSASYRANRILGDLAQRSAKYPRIIQFLRGSRAVSVRKPTATWPDSISLIDESRADEIDHDRLRRLAQKRELTPGAHKLLFHWCAWRKVHRGTLEDVPGFTR